jgi:xylitol oxidase
MTDIPSTNWAKSFRYSFRDCLYPTTVEDLRAQVAAASNVKVLGSRHSFNALPDGDVAIVLSAIPLDPQVSEDRKSVTIAGHATYGELAEFLAGHNLAIHNLASLPHISIAGAIATATHGSGARNGNLGTGISALEFVTADGSVNTVRRGEADFDGMVVHLGALGVVSRVTLDVQPTYDIAQTVYEGLSEAEMVANLDAILNGGYSVSIFKTWKDRDAQIWVKDKVYGSIAPSLFGTRLATVKRHPILAMDPVNTTEQLSAPGPWSDRLAHFKLGFTPSNGDEIQSEYHLPRAHGPAAAEAMIAIRDKIAPAIQVTEFRTVAADTLWLSPQYQRDTLSIHFTWLRDEAAVNEAVRHLEEALAPLDALPHWGKVFKPAHVGGRYAKLADFRAIRDRMDPTGKFSNPWLEQNVFGSAPAA